MMRNLQVLQDGIHPSGSAAHVSIVEHAT